MVDSSLQSRHPDKVQSVYSDVHDGIEIHIKVANVRYLIRERASRLTARCAGFSVLDKAANGIVCMLLFGLQPFVFLLFVHGFESL